MVVFLVKDNRGKPGYFIFGRVSPIPDGARFEILKTESKSGRPPGIYSVFGGMIINQSGQEVSIDQLTGEIVIQGSH